MGEIFGGKGAKATSVLENMDMKKKREATPDAPQLSPDITSDIARTAEDARRRRLMMQQGLSSTFLTGKRGDMTAAPTTQNKLMGS